MPKSKSKDFRRIFVAPPGQLFLALDYNQIELRAAAEFVSDWWGQPSILQQAFTDGLDAHTATAQRMTGKNRPEDVTPEERQAASCASIIRASRASSTRSMPSSIWSGPASSNQTYC